MRIVILLLCLLLSIASCTNSKKDKDTQNTSEQEDLLNDQNNLNSTGKQKIEGVKNNSSPQIDNTKNEDINTALIDSTANNSSGSMSGIYINEDHRKDTSCNCYCLDVSTSGNTKLCLKENELYVDARFQKNGDNIDIYYSGQNPVKGGEEIPWDKFDTGTPIAVLSREANNTLKLDWKGFSINGEIALDYAIIGKKTLEGTYKKK